MTETTDRPLVTFALFAYNQEQYIREAVEGAFAQTYEPLEIILSDDGSRDRTFEILQSMASSYDGAHNVIVRKNKNNIGTIDHLITTARGAKGKFLVVAAGDDISQPSRVESIVDAWSQDEDYDAIYSLADIIDPEGITRIRNFHPPRKSIFRKLTSRCVSGQKNSFDYGFVPGYSAAYKVDLISNLPFSNKRILSEDFLLSLILKCCAGKISMVERSLVKYRVDTCSVPYSKNPCYRFEKLRGHEIKIAAFSASAEDFYNYLFHVFEEKGITIPEKVRDILIEQKKLSDLRACYFKLNFLQKLKRLANLRTKSAFRYGLPRLFGVNLYCTFKVLRISVG